MIRKLKLLCYVILSSLSIDAGYFEIVSFGYIEGTPALKSKERVKDENGNDCALIKVQTLEKSMKFSGDIVGVPENKINEYWVYIKPSAKSLTISAPNKNNVVVIFADYQEEPLMANLQYSMIVKIPQKKQIISNETSIEELTAIAKEGNVTAALELGKRYMVGNGVAEDACSAKTWFAYAADKGSAEAQYRLGRCYAFGQGVTEKSYQTAVTYYQLSANQGFADAIYALGVCYEKGQGVETNNTIAMNYYKKAANLGHKGAQKRLNNQ